tara:strand:+ start:407 stop:739 length:333 start_codon:yes stop_codon:yes gene_type:complete
MKYLVFEKENNWKIAYSKRQENFSEETILPNTFSKRIDALKFIADNFEDDGSDMAHFRGRVAETWIYKKVEFKDKRFSPVRTSDGKTIAPFYFANSKYFKKIIDIYGRLI